MGTRVQPGLVERRDLLPALHLHSISQGGLDMNDDVIRVAADSPPSSVAGAIAKQLRAFRRAETQAIGVAAVNQMMKSVIAARRYLTDDCLDLWCVPSYEEIPVEGRTLSAMRLLINAYSMEDNPN